MKLQRQTLLFILPIILIAATSINTNSSGMATFTADLSQHRIELYWKDKAGNHLYSLGNLKNYVERDGKQLLCGMNAGMYTTDNKALGLFIQEYKTITPLNTRNASGNFYMKPNGVFYITKDNHAAICKTEDFKTSNNIRIATQSGPMLVINGQIHSDFKQGSANVQLRNGIGILPDGKVLFAISKAPVNLYDFALFFKNAGCKNALFLDGFVSRAYIPSANHLQTDGQFGVMVGVTQKM